MSQDFWAGTSMKYSQIAPPAEDIVCADCGSTIHAPTEKQKALLAGMGIKPKVPSKGDYCVCHKCTSFLMFEAGWRVMTDEDVAKLKDDEREALIDARRVLLEQQRK